MNGRKSGYVLPLWLLVALGTSAWAWLGNAAEPPGPLSPQASQACFEVVPGHVVELVAAEPLVFDPVAICFDADGRLYVAEMSDYPNSAGGGRVVILTDADGDGRIDTRSLFAQGLPFPNGLLAWRGGLLVTAAPDILWLADTDGDSVADVREVVLSGFQAGNQQLRVNGLASDPTSGSDGWVYAANGRSGGSITSPKRPAAPPVSIDRHDLRFRPDTGEVEAVAGFSQFGLAFDADGNRFSNWNTAPIRHVAFPLDVASRHPFSAPKSDLEVLEDPGQQNRLFPIGAAPLTFNREPTDAFNASCGLSIDTGGLLTPLGCAYVCEPLLNIVHRRELVPRGSTFEARRPLGEESREFLASRDPWFRPVFTATGPDGALWICDFYRRFVEHPDFVKAELRDGVEWDEGKDRGRIWRVRPADTSSPPTLRHAAGHDFHDGHEAQNSVDPRQRRARLRSLFETAAPPERARLAAAHCRDADAGVRFEVALAAERFEEPFRAEILAAVLGSGEVDPWVDRAVLCVAEGAAIDLVATLATVQGPDSRSLILLCALAEECGRKDAVSGEERVSKLLEDAAVATEPALAIVAGWMRGRAFAGGEVSARFGGRSLDDWMGLARRQAAAGRERGDLDGRGHAIEILALDRGTETTSVLLELLHEPAGLELAAAALGGLRGRDDDLVSQGLLAAWPAATPAIRRGMLGVLMGLPRHLCALVAAIDEGVIVAADLDPDVRRGLLENEALSATDRERLEALLGGRASADRAQVMAVVQQALPAEGEQENGRGVFLRHCSGCHRSGDVGARVGPDLTGMHAKPREQLLEDILDPNRRLTGEYAAVVVVTKDGEVLTGILVGESPTAVQLKRQTGMSEGKSEGISESIPRGAIEVFRGTGKSLMPEGFEQSISPVEFADLLAFLRKRP